MTASCPDCDQLSQARADFDQEFLAYLCAGVSFIAACWRVGKARRRLRALEETQVAAIIAVVEHQDVDEAAVAEPESVS